jgi:hypothetical protein
VWSHALDVANGEEAPVHPVHYALVQLWLSWRVVQHDMHDDTSIKVFAADCDTTTRMVSVLLAGSPGPRRYSFGTVRNWALSISDAWEERGVPFQIWLVARPDGNIVSITKSTQGGNP